MFTADIQKLERNYLSNHFSLNNWNDLQPVLEELKNRPIDNKADLEKFLQDVSEVEAAVNEDACWRQIKMTCDTENKALEESFNFFCMEIQPKIQPYTDVINKKIVESPFVHELPAADYHTYLRSVKNHIELFREENIPVQAEIAVLQQQFGQITGAMTVNVNGKDYTLQQAGKFLEDPDRNVREEVYRKIQERRLQDKETLDELFDKLIALRQQLAKNAGFENYTGYRFKELGRFDYGVQNCIDFHEAVKQHVVPLVHKIHEEKKAALGLDTLRPWDLDAEPAGTEPLRPFKHGAELLEKSKAAFTSLRPFFGACLQKMDELKHFDLESRKGKAPGGYNCPLAESGAPFIFMNAAGQMHDVTTMVHEGGHAIHSFLAHPLKLNGFKEYPMEIAEVASMAMELFSMDQWHEFFDNDADLRRAKLHQLERVITIFPWIATIDKFQMWVYANPVHTHEQRKEAWVKILNEFSDGVVNQEGLESYREHSWKRQLHLFEVPFYYIEYGIAQLGAIGLWMQFKQDAEKALDNYCNALSLGGTKTLPELYETAGLEFDFSPEKIKVLMEFVNREMEAIKQAGS